MVTSASCRLSVASVDSTPVRRAKRAAFPQPWTATWTSTQAGGTGYLKDPALAQPVGTPRTARAAPPAEGYRRCRAARLDKVSHSRRRSLKSSRPAMFFVRTKHGRARLAKAN